MIDAIKQIQGVKSELVNSLEDEIKSIPKYLAAIDDPEKKLNFIIKLMPYILPKIGNMDAFEYD